MPRVRVTPNGPLHEEEKCRGGSSRERTGDTGIPRADGVRLSFDRPPEDVPSYPPLADLPGFAVLALARVPDEAAKVRSL